MGSSEDEEKLSDNDATQKIKTPFFAGGGADDFPYLTDTMLSDDSFLLDDAFETQLVDHSGETQILELNGETQVLDDLGFLSFFPADVFNECDAEAAACSDTERTNKNEVLCDTQKVSQNDPVNIDGGDSIGQGKGSVSRGFTAMRAAAVRASGLAARAQGVNGNSCSTRSAESSLERSSPVENVSKSCLTKNEKHKQNEDTEEPRNTNSCKAGPTVARKLFMEEEVAEGDQSEADMNHTDDSRNISEFHAPENFCAGLSYANSQQPGELSQACANALEVVDKFLELNAMELDQGFDSRNLIAEKPTVLSGAKGSRDLAKSSIHRSTVGLDRVYDWDDTREADEGGDFFLRNKKKFFGKEDLKQRSLMGPMKRKCSGLRSIKSVGDHGDEEQALSKRKVGGSVYSDPGLMLHKLTSKVKSLYSGEKLFRKNLAKGFDEQRNLASECRSPNNNASEDLPDMENIGPDTQIAAEAMETLCFKVNLTDDNICPNKGARDTTRACKENQPSNSANHLEQSLTNPASVSVVTRRAKQTKRTRVSTSDVPLSENPGKRKKLTHPNNDVSLDEKEFLSTPPANIDKQKKGRGGIRSNIHEIDSHCGKRSAGRMSKKKSCLQEQLVSSVPVAHRTRKCTKLNGSEVTGENMSDLINAPDRKKRTAAKNKTAQIITIEKLRKLRSSGFKKSLASDRFDEKSAESTETNGRLEASPKERSRTPFSTCSTPARCATPVNNASPICMGDEYHSQTCRENISRFSLKKEVSKLINGSPGSFVETKELRKRRQITNIRVLFSQHLNVNVIKQQKKILTRLGAAVASSMSDATHFVADEFVRTRNMLEAIACGKPVVTHLWLESCGQASCLIDEKDYILRDVRKEKEFGFSMAVSLSRACQHPLLQGQRVLVTPNTKPGKDTLTSLIKAVHGSAVERLGRSVFKDEKLPDDLLILSCKEDYDICVPFLEKGGAVYSSELLLNGIVKQKLEYERHRLFADNVKRTRSRIWVKKKNQFLPVTKCK